MYLGVLVLITALTISGVAIYYSIAGLVAIFAAAALPIMIMGGALEIGKLVTAVWLHRYWRQAVWWLKTYLTVAVVVLMFITSMGIFGFLSKAHIEQTSAGEESVAQVTQIENEIVRLNAVIDRADDKIKALETSGTGSDANIQAQIDKEQERIDKAFDRIKPAIEQQNKIITDARATDTSRTKPYEDQLTSITAEILRLETSAKEYEAKIENLDTDSSGVEPLLAQIASIEEEIIRVTNQLQSKEQGQVRAGQAIIGVTSDGLFGGNTRTALAKWVKAQQDRITQIQGEVAQVRKDATSTVDAERVRLADVVKDIRTVQIPALKERELTMLGKIDEVRQTESPVIQTARDEIQRLRESAEAQVVNSQALIERLRSQLAQTDKADEIDAAVDEQLLKIKTAEAELDTLVEEKYKLEGEYRKLEAEVGPIKYIAEFVYGEAADNNMLEEAVRWVIIIIIFVFDPLAVLLLIASQYTFDFHRRSKDDSGERLRQWQDYEQARAQHIVDNPGYNIDDPAALEKEKVDVTEPTTTTDDDLGDMVSENDTTNPDEADTRVEQSEIQTNEDSKKQIADSYLSVQEALETPVEEAVDKSIDVEKKDSESSEESERLTEEEFDALDSNNDWKSAKTNWKNDNPNETLKEYKDLYLNGVINELPWEKYLPEGLDLKKKKRYIMKEKGQQVRKETDE
jgi:chromosome segregation ATPase